jgi:predicted nucleic acid-binding protein
MRVLADTTAMIAARRGRPAPSALFRELAEDELWICDVVRLELLRGASNPRDMAALRAELDEVASAPIDEDVWQRAEEVYARLARLRGGRHRGVQPTDVLVAAAAEAQDLVVLHDDAHFDLIAEVTGQETLRLPA